MDGGYVGDPIPYFYGVARNVLREYVKKRPIEPLPLPDPPREEDYQCLERCLEQLTPKNRELVLEYYGLEKKAKIGHRKQLAERLGIRLNALRIRMHRIRENLQRCMEKCLELTKTR
ncbi:MAG TPA: hypothetical protein VNN73_12685 [Blastocatellia bacterium]|nr:hypothetical protein [Blastocatellia bacterium]